MTQQDPPNAENRQILEEAHKRRSQGAIVDVDEQTVKLVVFLMAGACFALRGNEVKEILPYSQIAYVPGCADLVIGIINVRGNIESVISLNRFLGLESGDVTRSSRIMIAEKSDVRSGILVDSVEDVIDVPGSGIQKAIESLHENLRDYASGQFMHKNRCVTILDLDVIFSRIPYES